MELKDLQEIIKLGEQTEIQFKETINGVKQLAEELVAFSNAKGGKVVIGVDDKHQIVGLTQEKLQAINQHISNASLNNVSPPIQVITDNVRLSENKYVIVVTVHSGLHKPYHDAQRNYWVKSGSDKRKATTEDLHRLMQESKRIYAVEQAINASNISNLNMKELEEYLQKEFNIELPANTEGKIQVLNNRYLMRGNEVSVGGALLFAGEKEFLLPKFCIKGISFIGHDSATTKYRDSEDFYGKISFLYKNGLAFLKRNLRKVQGNKGFNTIGDLEIPSEVLEELLVNALVHRDYFDDNPIKLFVFDDRVEIISPGGFPDSLTVEEALKGKSKIRNPLLITYAAKHLPYRGAGTGLRRAKELFDMLEIINESDRVVCSISRETLPTTPVTTGAVTGEVTGEVAGEVLALLKALKGLSLSRKEIQEKLTLRGQANFRDRYLYPALNQDLIEMLIPDKPNSSKQKYRLTEKGKKLLIKL